MKMRNNNKMSLEELTRLGLGYEPINNFANNCIILHNKQENQGIIYDLNRQKIINYQLLEK